MKNRLLLVVLLGLLLTPSVNAWHLSSVIPNPGPDEVRDTRNRVLATRTSNIDNGAPGNLLTYTFPWDPEYTYADTGHTIRVHLGYTIQHPSTSNGAWSVDVAKEITGNLDSCSIRVETIDPIGISLDAVPLAQHYAWDCLFTQSTRPHPHNHTIYVNRTVASGTPAAPTAETISVRLETEDVIILPNTHQNVTEHRAHSIELTMHENQFDGLGFDGTVLTVVWLITLVWCLRRGKLLAAGVGTIGVLVSSSSGISDGIHLVTILIFTVALWLEAIAHDRIYSRFLNHSNRREPNP